MLRRLHQKLSSEIKNRVVVYVVVMLVVLMELASGQTLFLGSCVGRVEARSNQIALVRLGSLAHPPVPGRHTFRDISRRPRHFNNTRMFEFNNLN